MRESDADSTVQWASGNETGESVAATDPPRALSKAAVRSKMDAKYITPEFQRKLVVKPKSRKGPATSSPVEGSVLMTQAQITKMISEGIDKGIKEGTRSVLEATKRKKK